VGRPLWREDGSVFCMCRWPLPAQSFSGPSPLGLAPVFYCLRFETSLFVASYDSQGHAGGIQSPDSNDLLCPFHKPWAQTAQKTQLLYCCVWALPSNGCLSSSTILALGNYATIFPVPQETKLNILWHNYQITVHCVVTAWQTRNNA
jgi:hypothetical protein